MEDKQFTRLTLEQSDRKITWEVPYEDVVYDDMMEAINTIMVGMTFHESQVYDAMVGYLREHADDKYDIVEIINDDEPEEIIIDGNSPHFYA